MFVSSPANASPPKIADPDQAVRDLLDFTGVHRVQPDSSTCLRALAL
jgi:hypothetical protein